MSSAAAVVQTAIEASMEDAFRHIVPIDLASIFTGYGPLPAVSGTRDETGPWDASGRSRTVVFSDGSTARESLTGYQYPHRFTYTINGFTGVLKLLAREAHGEWQFERLPDREATAVLWRYEFVSRSPWLAPVLRLFVQTLWRGYMRRALGLSKDQIEARSGQTQSDL